MLMTSNAVQDRGLAEIAVKEHRAGHCISHGQVKESIMESMGWK